MKLPISLPFGKKEKINYFLALLLRDESASAVIFEEINGRVKVLGKHEEHFKETLNETPLDELLDLLDKTISIAESTLPPNLETQKTVFGLKEDWVENSKIKKDYLLKLKTISEELDLKPIGFLVIHEAIAHLLQKEEGAPISAILVEIGNKNINVSVIKGGKIIDTKTETIKESISKTTDYVLHLFTNCEILPSNIFVFNNDHEEKLQQEFIGHSWSKSLPFLHLPQITTLPKGYDAKSILFGAATQMGFELPTENKKEEDSLERESDKIIVDSTKHHLPKEEKNIENTNKAEEETSLENFGFVKEEDIMEKKMRQESDVKKNDTIEPIENEDFSRQTKNINVASIKENNYAPKINENSLALKFSFFKKMTILMSLFSKITYILKLPFSLISKKNKKIILIPLIILFSFIALTTAYLFNLKATVTLMISPKIVEKTQDINFSTEKPSDFSKNIIKGELVSISKKGSLSAPATGTKETGEKAKGTVTLYGRFTEEKTLPFGTIITSSNNLQFTLDSSVKLASTSADASVDSSNVKVSVTAKDIGKESNLPSGTKFTVDSYPTTTVIGKNDVAFSGGTKKDITVVSKSDIDNLAINLPKKLQENINSDLAKKISSDKALLPILIDPKLTDQGFSKKAGDQADTVTINGTVLYQAFAYEKGDLENYSKNLLQNDIKDMVISEKGITYGIKNVKSKSDKETTATILIKTYLLPKIDSQKMSQEIAGKSVKDAQNVLSEIPNFSNADFNLRPAIPLVPKMLPFLSKNINFIIKSND